ncbi:DUF6547 family protein [Phyllobacterium sp. 22552]|uniref:DUF6547 family protein n=1 Tax=Phyllobacterium sp. 22552 TaxID=3453941 RepID=UPI003F84C839
MGIRNASTKPICHSLPMSRKESNFASFNDDQKLIIAEMLLDSRQSAIHDVCAHLEWLHSSERLTLDLDGVRLPTSPFFGTMHMDYTCRLNGDAWPDEEV